MIGCSVFHLEWEMLSRCPCSDCWSRLKLPVPGVMTNSCVLVIVCVVICCFYNTLWRLGIASFMLDLNQCYPYKIPSLSGITKWFFQQKRERGGVIYRIVSRIVDKSGCASGSVSRMGELHSHRYNPLL